MDKDNRSTINVHLSATADGSRDAEARPVNIVMHNASFIPSDSDRLFINLTDVDMAIVNMFPSDSDSEDAREAPPHQQLDVQDQAYEPEMPDDYDEDEDDNVTRQEDHQLTYEPEMPDDYDEDEDDNVTSDTVEREEPDHLANEPDKPDDNDERNEEDEDNNDNLGEILDFSRRLVIPIVRMSFKKIKADKAYSETAEAGPSSPKKAKRGRGRPKYKVPSTKSSKNYTSVKEYVAVPYKIICHKCGKGFAHHDQFSKHVRRCEFCDRCLHWFDDGHVKKGVCRELTTERVICPACQREMASTSLLRHFKILHEKMNWAKYKKLVQTPLEKAKAKLKDNVTDTDTDKPMDPVQSTCAAAQASELSTGEGLTDEEREILSKNVLPFELPRTIIEDPRNRPNDFDMRNALEDCPDVILRAIMRALPADVPTDPVNAFNAARNGTLPAYVINFFLDCQAPAPMATRSNRLWRAFSVIEVVRGQEIEHRAGQARMAPSESNESKKNKGVGKKSKK